MGKLQLQQVGKAYGKRPAVLQDISMHINDGDGSVAMLSRRHHLFCCRDMSAACFTICFTAVRAC